MEAVDLVREMRLWGVDEMNEGEFKIRLCKLVRSSDANLVVLRHEDIRTAGIPDISISTRMHTLWVEAKVTPGMKLSALQDRTLERLGGLYVVYNNRTRKMGLYAPRTGLCIVDESSYTDIAFHLVRRAART